MQHTLIPQKERKILRREYRTRVFIVFCFLLSISGIIGSAALFPSFLFAINEEKTQLSLLSSLRDTKDENGVNVLELDFKRDNSFINILSNKSKIPRPSAAIQSISGLRGSVKINAIAVDIPTPEDLIIIVQGIAPDRDSLLSFKSRLEELVPGGGVELPVSDLAKSKDIQFSMRIIQKFQ